MEEFNQQEEQNKHPRKPGVFQNQDERDSIINVVNMF